MQKDFPNDCSWKKIIIAKVLIYGGAHIVSAYYSGGKKSQYSLECCTRNPFY